MVTIYYSNPEKVTPSPSIIKVCKYVFVGRRENYEPPDMAAEACFGLCEEGGISNFKVIP